MGFPVKAILTNAGRDLLGRTHKEVSFGITRAVMGEGELLERDPRELTEVIAPVMEARKAHVSDPLDGKVLARFDATRPEDIPKDFYWREFGVYAMDHDAGHEILYCYNNAGAYPDHVSRGEAGMRTISVPIEIGEAETVTFVFDQTVAYARAEDHDAHVKNFDNPHKTTLGQLLGGGATEGGFDCGYWGKGSAVKAHDKNPKAHSNLTLDGNAFGTYEAGELALHETDPNVHPNIVVDGNI